MGCAAAACALVRRGWRCEGCGFLDFIKHSHRCHEASLASPRHFLPSRVQGRLRSRWASLVFACLCCELAALRRCLQPRARFRFSSKPRRKRTKLHLLTTKAMLMPHTARSRPVVRCSSKQRRHLMQAARHLSQFCSEHRTHQTTTQQTWTTAMEDQSRASTIANRATTRRRPASTVSLAPPPPFLSSSSSSSSSTPSWSCLLA